MKKHSGYSTVPLSFNRKMVAASVSVTREKSQIHAITQVDVSIPRQLIHEYRNKSGKSLSFTAYIVHCLAKAVAENSGLNAFIKGRRLILLDDVTVNVLVEREIKGERVPESVGISRAQKKSYLEIHKEIREAKEHKSNQLGSLSNMSWIRYIPGFLLRTFVRIASKNIYMQKKYGLVAVTAIGMFSKYAIWFVPHGGATIMLTVGSIENKPVLVDGKFENRDYLCLTVSFDHKIVDGAPAIRFMNRLTNLISSGELLRKELSDVIL